MNSEYKASICWECENAVPNKEGTKGCSWSEEFIPVEGWEAKPAVIRSMWISKITNQPVPRRVRSYCVTSCPEFKEG